MLSQISLPSVLADCLATNQSSMTVLPDKPQGVADAAELLLVGLPIVDGGHGVLARGSGAGAGSELVNKSSLGIRVGGISPERGLLSVWPSRLPEESDNEDEANILDVNPKVFAPHSKEDIVEQFLKQ